MADRSESPLARRVKELRYAAGITQQELAHRAGLSMSVVTQIEIGTRTDPKLSTLLGLARGLGVEVADLLAAYPTPEPEAEEPPPEPKKPRGRPRKGGAS